MTDGDEYVYRLGIDYRDLQKALDNVLTLLGRVDAAGLNLPRSFESGATKASAAAASLGAALKKASGTSIAPAVQKQNKALQEQAAALDKAAAAYGKYQTNLARNANGAGLTRLGGFQPERQSTKALTGLQASGAALRANGVALGAGGNAVLAAINAELAARGRVAAAIAQGQSAQDAATARFVANKQREFEAMQRVDAAIKAQVQANRYAAPGVASANVMTYAQQAESRQGDAAGLAAHLRDQERLTANAAAATLKANSATDRFNEGLRQSYQRTLPSTAYALGSVSRSATTAGLALVAAGAAPIAVAANYQDLYAQVKRTSDILTEPGTQGQKDQRYTALRQDLVDLSKQIPVTFADITKIATLGNQLGIKSEGIASFTKTVAEFSATTDVDVQSAAEAFGRLGELLNNTDYKQIGDQIAYLGVKSVATESEIIKTTTQLAVSLQSLNTLSQDGSAASAQQVKETTAATLALSTTVAGLGVKPEQARGTFIRAFGAIGSAVAKGGKELNDLARISNTTSADFASNWNAGGSKAYTQFLAFTQGLGSNTAEINDNLASIGIRAVRDRQTLGLLNQNPERANTDFANAQKGGRNDFLDTAFAVQSQTTLKQLQVLGQQVTAVFDSIGSSAQGPLLDAIKGLQRIVGVFDSISKNQTAATFLAIGAALSVVLGVLLVAVGGATRFASSLVYMQILLKDVEGGSSLLSGIWAGLSGNALKAAGATGVLAEALAAEGIAQDAATGASQRAIAALQAQSGQGAKTVITVDALTAALVEQGIAQDAAAGAAARTGGVVATTGGVMTKAASAGSKLGSAIGKVGLVGSLLALVLIVPSVVQGIQDIVNELKGATPEADALATAIENIGNKDAVGAQATITKGFQSFAGGGTSAKGTIGSTNLFNTGTPLDLLGMRNATGQGISAGYAAVNSINTPSQVKKGQYVSSGADVPTALKALQNTDAAIAQLYQDGNTKGATALLGQLRLAMVAAGVPTADLEKALVKTRAALGATGDESLAAAQKTKAGTDAEQDAAAATDAFNSSLSDLFDPTSQALAIAKDFEDIGSAVATSGAQVGLNGSEMQKAIQDIYASSNDMPTVKGRLQSLLDQLSAKGYTPQNLAGLQGAIDMIAGAAGDAKVDIDGFNKGLDGTGDSAAAATRTLQDYASDLASTFSRSYDLRFGNQNALDKVTSGWRSLTDSIKGSRDELAKAKADLAGLKADRGVTEYQLGIANQFGDTARAAVLRAQLEQQNADIKSKQADVTKAQADTSRALVGNSAGAIQNRSGLQGQIQSSQGYIQSLAANGATEKQIQSAIASQKAQFIQQATAAGFNRKEVVKMAAAYDDMKAIVKAIPKNLTTTFKAHTSAAEQAIAEYRASLQKVTGDKTTTIHVAYVDDGGTPIPGNTPINRTPGAQAAIAGKQAQLRGRMDGGYTGDGPVWQAAGIHHGQEYVLNQRATQMFPRAMLDGANHGIAPVMPTINTTATLGGDRTVSLGTTERRLLAQASKGGSLSIHGDRIAQAFDEEFRRANRRGQA